VACFAPDYRAEMPVHPDRGFTGRAQVRTNWEQILAFVPDLTVQVQRCTVDGATAWTEWEFDGTRRDGTRSLMRGVIIFEIAEGPAVTARLYLEPVQNDGEINDAVRREVVPRAGSAPGRDGPVDSDAAAP
jgi:hypothetical protein